MARYDDFADVADFDPRDQIPGMPLRLPEWSNWTCYLFGNKPGHASGFIWRPFKRDVPNIFVRFMMKICFGCTWIREKGE